jgi:hypothetical protein
MKEDILQSHLKDVELYGDFKSHKALNVESFDSVVEVLKEIKDKVSTKQTPIPDK